LKEEAKSEEEEEKPKAQKKEDGQKNIQISPKIPSKRIQKNHPLERIIGNMDTGVETRRKLCSPKQIHIALLSIVEPNNFQEANIDEHWIKDIEEELGQIEKNETWELSPRPKNKNVIGTKWVFRNKLNEDG